MSFLKCLLLIVLLSGTMFSCKKRGCTDLDAMNYIQTATLDDHSCYYFWIGQHYQGGDIFYVDKSKKHGLITATFNLQKGHGATGGFVATSTDVYTGASNTEAIVNAFGPGTAAYDCYVLDTLGYNDWFLPSKEEVVGLASTLGKLGQANTIGMAYVLTSSCIDANSIWTVYMPSLTAIPMGSSSIGFVRPMRAF